MFCLSQYARQHILKLLYFKESLCHTWKPSSGNQFSTVFTQYSSAYIATAIV